MTRIVAFFMTMALFCVQANAQDSLKNAFDELNYTLNVEWDQQDEIFYQNQVEIFQQKIENQELSNAEILIFLTSKIQDERLAKTILNTFNLVDSNLLTSIEAKDFILKELNHTYNRGTSWESDVDAYSVTMGAVGAAIVIGFATWFIVDPHPHCPGLPTDDHCSNY